MLILALLFFLVYMLVSAFTEGCYGFTLRNVMLNAGTAEMKYIAAFIASNGSGTCTQASSEIVKCTAPTEKETGRGASSVVFAAKQVVVFTSLTGGEGLKTYVPYFIKEAVSTTEVKLADTETGAVLTWSTAITAGTLVVLKEVSGAPYKRVATEWGASAHGTASDTAKEGIKVPPKTTVSFEGFFKEKEGGEVLAVNPVEPAEPIESEGTYSIISDTASLTSR